MSTWPQRGSQLPRPLFEGITVYVELYKAPYNAFRPNDISLLKEHGATISASHSHPNTTLIICSHPSSTAAPKSLVTQQSIECPGVSDIVTLCSRQRDLPLGKVILRREWIEDCVQSGVLLSGKNDWGGWTIKAAPGLAGSQPPTPNSSQGQPRKRFVPISGAKKPWAPASPGSGKQQARIHHSSQHTPPVDRRMAAGQVKKDGRHRMFMSAPGEGGSVIRTSPSNLPTVEATEKSMSPNRAKSIVNCVGVVYRRQVPDAPANTHGFSPSSTASEAPSAQLEASSDAKAHLVYPASHCGDALHEPRMTSRSNLESTSSVGKLPCEPPTATMCENPAQQMGINEANQAHIYSTQAITQQPKPDVGSPIRAEHATHRNLSTSNYVDDCFIVQTTSIPAPRTRDPAADSSSAVCVAEEDSKQSPPSVIRSVSFGSHPGIFTTSSGPLGIWIHDMVSSAPSISAMITRLGGGRMVPRASATHVLLALPPKACVTTPQHDMMFELIEPQPGRHVISIEWVIECFIQQRRVDEAAFTINLAHMKQTSMEVAKEAVGFALSRGEDEAFAKVFRIAKSTADLHGALRVVANSLGRSLQFWQTYYECHKHRLDRICVAKAVPKTLKPKRKRKRVPETSDDSSDSESNDKGLIFMKSSRKLAKTVEVSPPPLALTTQVTISTNATSSLDISLEPLGAPIVSSDIRKVNPVHLKGVNALKIHLRSWDERMSIAQFLAQLPSPPTSLTWAEIYTTYRDVFRGLRQDSSRSGSKRGESPDSIVGSESPDVLLDESRSKKDTRTSSWSIYTAPRITNHPMSPPFGKSYFTRSNLHTDRPGAANLTLRPFAAPRARRKSSRERVAMMTEIEQRRFLWYIGVHEESLWREITDGWAAETTACMRTGKSYQSWVSRQGSQDVKTKAAEMTEAARREGKLVWDRNGTCRGCHGSSADLEWRDKYELCVDCRALWDHAETSKLGKRAVKDRRGEVAAWVAAQVEL